MGLLAVQVKKSRRHKKSFKVKSMASGGSAFWTTLTQAINTESGAVSYLLSQQTQANTDSSYFDRTLSSISMYASYVTAGATLLSLAAGATAAAPILAGAATVAAVTGFLCGSLAMGNDYYNLFTSVYALASNQPGASAAQIESAFAALTADGITTYLNAEGLGGLLGANASVSTTLLKSIYTDIFTATADSATLGAAQLAVSTDNMLAQQIITDSNSAESSMQSVSPSDFGLVTGTCTIANSQGPILSGLSGVGTGNDGYLPDTLTSIAAPDGSYELLLPIGSPDLTYNSMDVAAFDPVDLYDPTINTFNTLGDSLAVDLSGVNPNSAIVGPSFTGACVDTDAGDPDGDDPDCD